MVTTYSTDASNVLIDGIPLGCVYMEEIAPAARGYSMMRLFFSSRLYERKIISPNRGYFNLARETQRTNVDILFKTT